MSERIQRWRGLEAIPAGWGRCVATIGVFDGVHLGHQRIVRAAAEEARRRGLRSVTITFDPHPDEVVRPGTHPPLLATTQRRIELLEGLGTDAVVVVPFTLDLSKTPPDEFVQQVLVDRLHAAHVIVGEDFRFGHKAKGDVALLKELGAKYDFTAEGMPLVANGDTISSTYIRERLESGDVAGAAAALGRPHRVEGVVVRGAQRGRELGYPTANVETLPHTAIPADGVYAGWLHVEGEPMPAAISVGTNPTFDGTARTVEAYAIDRVGLDLYGLHVAVDFLAYLRGMEKFDTIDALLERMADDVKRSRELVEAAEPTP